MNDRVAIEVLACLACDRAYQPGDGVDAAPCCDEPRPAFTVTVPATLAPGTLSAAIQRLGWAEWEFDLANKAWRAVMAGDEEDDQDASQAAFDRLRAATDARVAALAEVRRLRPTPPEGT